MTRVHDALQALIPPAEPGTDAECLNRFRAQQDEIAFAELVRRHGPLVNGVCRRILLNGADADDAFQATFFILARKAETIRGSVGSWLYGVAVRVAQKARAQAIKRRVRQMAAARPEEVSPSIPDSELRVVIDDELSRLPTELRQVLLACDVNGLSRSLAAKELGWPEGTVARRLVRARELLGRQLTRRGIALSATALPLWLADHATASVPLPLINETIRQALHLTLGNPALSPARTLAESVMRSMSRSVIQSWLLAGIALFALAGGGWMLANGPEEKPAPNRKVANTARLDEPGTMWKERFTVRYPGTLPVSVIYSPDGKTLYTGDTAGEVMALNLSGNEASYRWKTKVDGSHAAVAVTSDGKSIYATTKNGVCILEPTKGVGESLLEAKDSNPVSIGVFPDKLIAKTYTRRQIVFGNASGYFVKSWAEGKLPDSVGTIETSTVAKGAKPADDSAVPLAVDPKGRSAIMTGPLDGGKFRGSRTKNVLWAYVCGNYDEGSPGNRVMVGHDATVVSAAWSKEGGTAVTGDTEGRVIFWDAKTMKETRRVEFKGRIAALAISNDGKHTAAYVLGKTGEVFVWETAKPANDLKTIHTDLTNFEGATSFASLAFSPDGKQLAGCGIDKRWLNRLGELVGKVRIWELTNEPKAQIPPRHLYTHPLEKRSSTQLAFINNHTFLLPSGKDGAIDYRDPTDGSIYSRITFGKFTVGGITLSTDRNWLAMEQHEPFDPSATGAPKRTFDLSVTNLSDFKRQSISNCSRFLDVASGGVAVAVVRDHEIELWNSSQATLVKKAPFKFTEINASCFSPDGKVLAVADRSELVLWQWLENTHERFKLAHTVKSLAFSPDGKFLAEGPVSGKTIPIRDLATNKIVKELSTGAQTSMTVSRMLYAQGGRVLIATDTSVHAKDVEVPSRVNLWDTETGQIAHRIAIASGIPQAIDIAPNGRYLLATIEDGDDIKLSAWEIGESKERDPNEAAPKKGGPPAAIRPEE